MSFLSSATRFALVSAAAVLVAALLALLAPLPELLKALPPALVAAGVGFAGWRAGERSRALLAARAAEQEAALAASAKAGAQLRHDLRGMLSPALLNADRLSTNTDPAARRAAEAMIVAIERMEQRLREG